MFKFKIQDKQKRKRRLGKAWYNPKRQLYEACVESVVDVEQCEQIKLPNVFYLVQKLKAVLVRYFEELQEYQDEELEKTEKRLKEIWYEIYEQIAKNQIRPP